MKGSVRKRGSTWSFRLDLGTVSGKRKQIEKGGFSTKKDAQVALNIALAEHATTGQVFVDQKLSLDTVFNEFITSEAQNTRKFTTIKRYKSVYCNHILDELGPQSITNVTPSAIQKMLTEKRTTLSAEYTRGIFNLLLVIFGYAERMGYIKTNPISKVNPPKNGRLKDPEVYSHDDLQWLYSRLESTNLQTAYMLGIHLGLRAGEVYALQWSDFDFTNSTVKITKQLQYYGNAWCFTTLKTENSMRTISFGQSLRSYLINLQNKIELSKQHYGKMYKTNQVLDARLDNPVPLVINDFVNVKPDGQMLNTHSHKVISRICVEERNLNFKFHNLRHTHATMLLEDGLNPRYIQERLGHSKLEFTLRLYTHVTATMETKAAGVLDNRLKF